jgi:hypothetical protein
MLQKHTTKRCYKVKRKLKLKRFKVFPLAGIPLLVREILWQLESHPQLCKISKQQESPTLKKFHAAVSLNFKVNSTLNVDFHEIPSARLQLPSRERNVKMSMRKKESKKEVSIIKKY